MKLVTFILSLNAFFALNKARFVRRNPMEKKEMAYLKEYGYTDEVHSMSESIKMFQKFAHLNETGRMNKITMAKMEMPRCGNKENMHILKNSDIQTKQNAMVAKWNRSELKYFIKNLPRSGLEADIIEMNVRKAFDMWQEVTNLKFTRVTVESANDINILFVDTNQHRRFDDTAFGTTEVGRSIAHAFYPQGFSDEHRLEGDIHFDDDRGWTVDTQDGINFFQVCVHEIGHAIGLRHSMIEESAMYMIAKQEYIPDFRLHEDDIQGVQNLYGAPTSSDYSHPIPISANNYVERDYELEFTQDIKPLQPHLSNIQNIPNNPAPPVLPLSPNIVPYLLYCNYLQNAYKFSEAQECFNNLDQSRGLY